jgi:hypothetical protein
VANRNSRIVIPVRAVNYDGHYWGDYPNGNKPNTGAVLQADALGRIGAAGQLTTAIRLGAGAQDVIAGGGGLSSGIKLAAGAQDVVSESAQLNGPAFDFSGLYTSQNMTVDDNTSGADAITWRTDEAEPYARITYNAAGTIRLLHSLLNRSANQMYVSYYVRRFGMPCSKQCKFFGQIVSGAYSNTTFGPTAGGYSDNEFFIYYGDTTTGGNDNSVQLHLDGTLISSSYSRAAPTFVYAPSRAFQTVDGSAFDHMEVFAKYNSNSTQNGEFGIARNGSRIFQESNAFNTPNGCQLRDYFTLGDFSASSGFFEDYKKVDMSTSYRPSWMT